VAAPVFLELGLGALLVVGLFTKEALTLAFFLIAALVFGSSVRQDWATVGVSSSTHSPTLSCSRSSTGT
jgi:hypothetical protein